jgi:hypothetical protein
VCFRLARHDCAAHISAACACVRHGLFVTRAGTRSACVRACKLCMHPVCATRLHGTSAHRPAATLCTHRHCSPTPWP